MTIRRGGAETIFVSIENPEGNRCVDLFVRADGSFGFEEYRRDPEDGGVWTPVTRLAGLVFASEGETMAAARGRVPWLAVQEPG